MATYATLKSGSRGDSVKQLQEALNSKGYTLSTDGVFGTKTAAAVRDYQSKNGLTVDGIAGTNTWNSLMGGGSGSAAGVTGGNSYTSASKLTQYESSLPSYSPSAELNSLKQTLSQHEASKPGAYTPSAAVNQAAEILKQYEASKPGEYTSNYQDKINSLLDEVLNRPKFEYNFVGDPLYQQYKDKYIEQGKMSMRDTMGQAAGLTGGYGSSYAQAVGQQAYDRSLQQLNDVIPELRDAAYKMYMDEQNLLTSDLALLRDLENADYGKYRDLMADYYNNLDYYSGRYDNERNYDYGLYRDRVGDWEKNRDYYLGKYSDMSKQEYDRYLNELNSWKDERDYWFKKQQYDDALAAAAASTGGGGGRSGSGSGGGSAKPDANAILEEMKRAYSDTSSYGGANKRDLAMSILDTQGKGLSQSEMNAIALAFKDYTDSYSYTSKKNTGSTGTTSSKKTTSLTGSSKARNVAVKMTK